MAKSEYQIRMNYQKTLGQADELDKLSRQLRQLAEGNVGNIRGRIQSNWRGSNADRYLDKMNQFQKSLSGTAEKVTTLSGTLRGIAKNTYQADMKVMRLAQQRN